MRTTPLGTLSCCASYSSVNDAHSTIQLRRAESSPANTPFSILGLTQLLNVAKVIAKMDHGYGFCLPLTLTEMEVAANHLSTEAKKASMIVSRTSMTMVSFRLPSSPMHSSSLGRTLISLLQGLTKPSETGKSPKVKNP